MNLNHRIIAVLGNNIKRVHCLTCGSDHNYHPPKREPGQSSPPLRGEKPEKRPSTAAARPLLAIQRSAARAESEWTAVMNEMPSDHSPRPYSVFESYKRAEFIQHPVFGVGRVIEILGREKMEVIFKEGRKVLLCCRKR
jgi:hypothetical protein